MASNQPVLKEIKWEYQKGILQIGPKRNKTFKVVFGEAPLVFQRGMYSDVGGR